MRRFPGLAMVLLMAAPVSAATRPSPKAARVANVHRLEQRRPRSGILRELQESMGIGVNNPVVGKLNGDGGVQYFTALDVSNNTAAPLTVVFSFDGADVITGAILQVSGNFVNPGLVGDPALNQTMSPYSNAHFDDFLADLRDAGFISAQEYDDGVLGSLLIVYLGTTSSGQGSSQARFYSNGCGGTIGGSARGQEITINNAQKLVGVFRDTTGEPAVPQLYPNLFLNNVGVTQAGLPPTDNGNITVLLTAYSATDTAGAPIAQVPVGPIGAGQTVAVPHVLGFLGIPAGQFDTVLVFAEVTAGESALEGLAVEVDQTTRDGSSAELGRADFFTH